MRHSSLTWQDAHMETGFPWGSTPTVDIRLWRADAIVLFDWLMSTDLHTVPITHPAQKQALVDLLARLEDVDVMESTEEEIAAAQAEVAKDMGW
ncbi:hypothetical protein [Streptomyces sp. NPDC057682]|uniref:hypothetical protein n=1 Tax=Streptomyces sp. NPDC057682 TaxID=3346210 RepID=UPI0036CEB751